MRCRYRLSLLLMLLALPDEGIAQTTGTCAEAQAEAFLDVNNVRARIFNNGALFWKGEPATYEVPAHGGQQAMFTTTLLVGGTISGEVRASAARFGRYEFWPGPLDDQGNPPVDCSRFDRLYEITSEDIKTYNTTGFPTQNLVDWPWHLGAPIIDGDSNPNNYTLDGGDRPALLGDQMLWWVMNDAGGEHEETRSAPLGLEVRGSAFSYRADGPLGNTTFYRYHLTYKGTEPLEEAYVGLFADVELGNFADDYVGADTLLHLGYAYNADNDDEGGYGERPPAIGYTVLRGPHDDGDGRDNDYDGTTDEADERLGMEALSCYIKNYKAPRQDAATYYNCLQGLWADGTPMIVGGQGTNSTGTPTRFVFPGDPVAGTFWSEVNANNQGQPMDPADRRFYLSSGPFTMQPGETEEFTIALVWARGTDHLDAVVQLKEAVAGIRHDAARLLQPDITLLLNNDTPPSTILPELDQNYPNPFTERTTIRYRLPRPAHVRLVIYDILGREVAIVVNTQQQAGPHHAHFNAGDLPPGVYIYQMDTDHQRTTRRLTHLR